MNLVDCFSLSSVGKKADDSGIKVFSNNIVR